MSTVDKEVEVTFRLCYDYELEQPRKNRYDPPVGGVQARGVVLILPARGPEGPLEISIDGYDRLAIYPELVEKANEHERNKLADQQAQLEDKNEL